MADESKAPWVGWVRPGKRGSWRPVVSGDSWGAAWDALVRHPDRGDKVVMRTGCHPSRPVNERDEEP